MCGGVRLLNFERVFWTWGFASASSFRLSWCGRAHPFTRFSVCVPVRGGRSRRGQGGEKKSSARPRGADRSPGVSSLRSVAALVKQRAVGYVNSIPPLSSRAPSAPPSARAPRRTPSPGGRGAVCGAITCGHLDFNDALEFSSGGFGGGGARGGRWPWRVAASPYLSPLPWALQSGVSNRGAAGVGVSRCSPPAPAFSRTGHAPT